MAHFGRWADRAPAVLDSAASTLTPRFALTHAASDSRARAGVLHTPHGAVETPFFGAVGAVGSVDGLTPAELRELGTRVLLANTYDLLLRPGADRLRQHGGLHGLLAWDGPIISDSGSLEVFSLGFDVQPARGKQAPRLVRVDADGASFTSYIDGSRHTLTPEGSMAIQAALGADVTLAFDEPTAAVHDFATTRQAMERTHAWAPRCLDARQRADQALYGVVQGGAFEPLRAASARYVGTLPFDGTAIGGSLGTSSADLRAVVEWSLAELPTVWPRHVSGVHEPGDLLACVELGIDQFASAEPTRLGRAGTLYTPYGLLDITLLDGEPDGRPIQADCGCYTCATGFSRGYLGHLLAAHELLGSTLGSLHNLYFIEHLMQQVRAAIRADRLTELRDGFLSRYRAHFVSGTTTRPPLRGRAG